MVITKIVGGLGNQMFQYAIGRAMAEKHNLPLKLDIADFKTYRRPYFLDKFTIKEDYLPDDIAAGFRKYETRRSPWLLFQNLKSIKHRNYRLEKPSEYFKFNPDFLEPAPIGDTYLNGYWQNEKYFSDFRSVILKDFKLKPEFGITDALIQEVETCDSISLHFRRGADQVNKIYGVPSPDYYNRAIDHISLNRRDKKLKLYIFTNEVEWVRENVRFDLPTIFVTEQGRLTDFQELVLMSHCRHNIIANSTFSWWAAWLNDYPERIICAPNPWFINKPDAFDTSGLLPTPWIKINS